MQKLQLFRKKNIDHCAIQNISEKELNEGAQFVASTLITKEQSKHLKEYLNDRKIPWNETAAELALTNYFKTEQPNSDFGIDIRGIERAYIQAVKKLRWLTMAEQRYLNSLARRQLMGKRKTDRKKRNITARHRKYIENETLVDRIKKMEDEEERMRGYELRPNDGMEAILADALTNSSDVEKFLKLIHRGALSRNRIFDLLKAGQLAQKVFLHVVNNTDFIQLFGESKINILACGLSMISAQGKHSERAIRAFGSSHGEKIFDFLVKCGLIEIHGHDKIVYIKRM